VFLSKILGSLGNFISNRLLRFGDFLKVNEDGKFYAEISCQGMALKIHVLNMF
jgi:hypothetical protein